MIKLRARLERPTKAVDGFEPMKIAFVSDGGKACLHALHGLKRHCFPVGGECLLDKQAVLYRNILILALPQDPQSFDQARVDQHLQLVAHPPSAGARRSQHFVCCQGVRADKQQAVNFAGCSCKSPWAQHSRPLFSKKVGCCGKLFESGVLHSTKISKKNERTQIRIAF